ncbi:MAG: hypothetical protein KQH59_18645 [Desulfobulbaceae bacterium]|nr:hypothetical protein [Desulfobulbaceae bacterium]
MGFDGAELKRRKKRAERIAKKINKAPKETTSQEVTGETINERLNNLPPEQRDLAIKTFLFVGLLVLLIGWWGWHELTAPDEPTRRQATSVTQNIKPASTPTQEQPARTGTISRDLGPQITAFGSTRQAQALLQFMDEWPDRNEYLVSYNTDSDTVSFGCNFQLGTLSRRHDYPSGESTIETWNRYILERLQAAAGGGSLNDTPKGKVFAEEKKFQR